MHSTPVRNISKRALKYGGKSGILPEVRPIFRGNPIAPKSEEEKLAEAKLEQGYVEGVPLPKRKGFTFHRVPLEKKVVTVEERIKRNIEDKKPDVDVSTLNEDELWAYQRDEIRRLHLKDAYLAEARRLERIDAWKAKKAEKEKIAKSHDVDYEDSKSTQLTLPTIDSYLQGPLMRPRTAEEEAIVSEQRILNRKSMELIDMERKANDLLQLYHSASNFITTEDELAIAIRDAFEVKVGKFESSERLIEDKLFGYNSAYSDIKLNEKLVRDVALGEIDGQPGLETIKDTLSGETEKIRREAQTKLNHN